VALCDPGAQRDFGPNCHRLPVANPQLRGQGGDAVSKEAIGHNAIQQRGRHTPVEEAFVALEARVGMEGGFEFPILARLERQGETVGIGATTDQAKGMKLPLKGF